MKVNTTCSRWIRRKFCTCSRIIQSCIRINRSCESSLARGVMQMPSCKDPMGTAVLMLYEPYQLPVRNPNFDTIIRETIGVIMVILISSTYVIILANHPKLNYVALHQLGWTKGWNVTTINMSLLLSFIQTFSNSRTTRTERCRKVYGR